MGKNEKSEQIFQKDKYSKGQQNLQASQEMTQIFVAIPFKFLQQRLDSSLLIKQLVGKLDGSMIVENVFWTKLQKSKIWTNQQQTHNKCIIEVSSLANINYGQAVQNYTKVQQLQKSLDNIKQDLRHMMEIYQKLKRQHQQLLKRITSASKQKENSVISNSLKQASLQQKQKTSLQEQPLSLSLQVNSRIASEREKSQFLPPQKSKIKVAVASLEKQVSHLTRENLQLKNTIIYYESRLQFVGQYLKKMEEQKQKEKTTLRDNKKQKK